MVKRTLETYSYTEYMDWISFYGGKKLLKKYYMIANYKTGKHKYVVVYKEEKKW